MALAQRLEQDLKTALRAGDAIRVSTIRLARAAIHNEEIERGQIVAEGIAQARATARKDTGKVMALVMPRVAGRADGQTVNRIVQEMLPEKA